VGVYKLSARIYNAYVSNTYAGATVWVMPIISFRPWFLPYTESGWYCPRFCGPAIPI
jgi:hypothetical protein